MYRPSEKVQFLSQPAQNLGPEFQAGEITHEIERCKAILRNPRATEFDKTVAASRITELRDRKIV
jgi:hypothetical protein